MDHSSKIVDAIAPDIAENIALELLRKNESLLKVFVKGRHSKSAGQQCSAHLIAFNFLVQLSEFGYKLPNHNNIVALCVRCEQNAHNLYLHVRIFHFLKNTNCAAQAGAGLLKISAYNDKTVIK